MHVRIPSDMEINRERCAKTRKKKIITYTGWFLLSILFVLNGWFGFIPWFSAGFSSAVGTIGGIITIIAISYQILKQKPWAYLIYTCVHTVEFEDYIVSVIDDLEKRLDYNKARAMLLSQSRAQQIYRMLSTAYQLKEISDDLKELPTKEAIERLAWINAPRGFQMKLMKYGK